MIKIKNDYESLRNEGYKKGFSIFVGNIKKRKKEKQKNMAWKGI